MDFYIINKKFVPSLGDWEVYPNFVVGKTKDLMVRGKSFYAIWDEENQLWSIDEYIVPKLIDKELKEFAKELGGKPKIRYISDFSSRSWLQFKEYLKSLSNNSVQLDETLTFLNDKTKRTDYSSRRLPYVLKEGSYSAWDEIISTLYNSSEREKIEWAIGSILAGDSKTIQKFIALYGKPGTGKSTILNIIEKLFEGYCTIFESEGLTSRTNAFATEAFRDNPLVAIEHDGDLSKAETITKLNSITSHEIIRINEKHKASYTIRINAFLFMGTNKAIKIAGQKAGLIRRLIDVQTSGRKLPPKHIQALISQIDFELGAIAYRCREVYYNLGKNYYASYRPIDMMSKTDYFYNFMEANYFEFVEAEAISLARLFDMYKAWCDESLIQYRLSKPEVREQAIDYFNEYYSRFRKDNSNLRNVYVGLKIELFAQRDDLPNEPPVSLVLDSDKSCFDEICHDAPAQYAKKDGIPSKRWAEVDTKLSDLDTTRLHYVKPPLNHIVVDFDLTDEKGEKSSELNLEEASKWPPTYAEYSKSKKGIHLHYIYDGDPERLVRLYSEGIEIKVFVGDASLRRQLSKCNTISITHLNGGLPLKGEKKVINAKVVSSEKGLRDLLIRSLNKEIHPEGTKPSIDFIHKILDDAYKSGMTYDLTTMRPKVLTFAMGSSNQAEYCVKLVNKMHFKSEDKEEPLVEPESNGKSTEIDDSDLVFFDAEVYPNLFIVCWKHQGPDKLVAKMINPEPKEIEELFKLKLVGFNNRDYDNHILYGRYLGLSLSDLHKLSGRIIGKSENAKYRSAYNISFADVFDFSSLKQGLKKFQIELGLEHKELNLPFDEPVSEELWMKVVDYCANDVVATEAVFNNRKQDYIARKILADLSGLTINDTTQQHTARIMFGNDPNPQTKFNYVDLSKEFPGYVFENGVSSYRGENPSEGGYVYAEPGIYENVFHLDVASMHPSSILEMNMFGPYTPRYKELLDARISIKHKDYDKAKKLLGGLLSKYLNDPEDADALAYALKIHALNIVYGLTSASFPNKFKDPRNIDNIVAKRGALFMIDLKHAVQDKGFTVAHIKTDSIKIPNGTPEIMKFVMEFGKKYGYTFEFDDNFERLCLVNDSVYIAKCRNGLWVAVGAEFAHPYVFKTLFSHEEVTFEDLCELKSVSSKFALYLDYNEGLQEEEHNYTFIGRVGSFCPVKEGTGGGILFSERNGKYVSVTGTKGYRWKSSDVIKELDLVDDIDFGYHNRLVEKAIAHISKFGDFEKFVSK